MGLGRWPVAGGTDVSRRLVGTVLDEVRTEAGDTDCCTSTGVQEVSFSRPSEE